MQIDTGHPVHLTYCMNVHPAESWIETVSAIKTHVLKVKERVAPDRPFGLGLRLSAGAVAEGRAHRWRIGSLKSFLKRQGLYVFTVNGFPYGQFHGKSVKQAVYRPDWRTRMRRDYTMGLADILCQLLPPGVTGSISTLPGSYRAWVISELDVRQIVRHLMEVVAYLDGIRRKTGKLIHLGLEPEPDCWLETAADVESFFSETLLKFRGHDYLASLLGTRAGKAADCVRRHLGVCLDTCHSAMQFEAPLAVLRRFRAAGILVSKVQLSAALCVPRRSGTALRRLAAFADPVYLHQTRIRDGVDRIHRFPDLPDALAADRNSALCGEWRVHVHVPLYMRRYGELSSTNALLSRAFFKACWEDVEHLEIETYTFGVLPEPLQKPGLINSLDKEFNWVLKRLRGASQS